MKFITIDANGIPSLSTITVGNQWENLDETIQFSFPENFAKLYKYVVARTYKKDTKENITRVFPLAKNKLVIGSSITCIPGTWYLYTLCKSSEVNLDTKTIDLRAQEGEHISISDAIIARVNANDINAEAIENIEIDPNIKIIYDELFDFKAELENNEAARQTNESLRKQAEVLRVNAETERKQAEQSRADAETVRVDNENIRKQSEATRVESEKARVSAETARNQSESSRVNAENKRVETEKSRVSAESLRASAENERVKSETLRKQSEQTRSNEESSRQSAERTRVSEENARKNAETARAQAEQSRVNVESQRVSAETNRVNAERARSEAETNRVNAEQSRVDAEALRVTADTERTEKTNTALKTLEDAVESEREKYSHQFFENSFALQRTGKVYTVKFPLWATSHNPNGEKLDDNEGLVLEPSTKTFRGRNDYANIPLFKTYDVNAYVDDDGVRHVTAIKGDTNFEDTGKNDVFVMQMSYYEKTWADEQYWYYSITDTPRDGYTIARECINRDGTTQPFALYSKYVTSFIDDKPYSTKGQAPARYCSNPNEAVKSVNNSYNGLIDYCKKKGKFYTGGTTALYKYVLLTQQLMLGTTVPKSKIWGCANYWVNTPASIKSAEKHTYFPVTKAKADSYPIGAGVSVGYKHLNSDGKATDDKTYSEIHKYANDVTIIRKELLGDDNVAIYLDVTEPFNTMPVQLSDTVTSDIYLFSMHWNSGFSDSVLDRCGCPCEDKSGLTSGRYPMVWQGIELMVGGYETLGNAFMNIVSLTTRDVYVCNDATKLTKDENQAKAIYTKLPYQMTVAKNSQWNYVTEIKLDLENGAFVQTQSGQDGSSSATGFGDAIYFDGATSGTREFLSLGNLGYGSNAGLAYCDGSGWLDFAAWYVLARLSVNAVGGELTA